jgi:hypothetical protein
MQCLIGHLTNGPQWMILRNPIFKADIAEYRFLLMVVSAHINYLNHLLVETESLIRYTSPFFRKLFSRADKVSKMSRASQAAEKLIVERGMSQGPTRGTLWVAGRKSPIMNRALTPEGSF